MNGPCLYEMGVIIDGVSFQTYSAKLTAGNRTDGPSIQNPKADKLLPTPQAYALRLKKTMKDSKYLTEE